MLLPPTESGGWMRIWRWLWRRLSDLSTAQWIAGGCGGGITFASAVVTHVPLWAALFFSTGVFAFISIVVHYRTERANLPAVGPPAPESPLAVVNTIHAETLPFVDDTGVEDPAMEVVRLSIRITNGRNDGATLRNFQARMHFISGESVVLPVTNITEPTAIRHGEHALVEIGKAPILKGSAMTGIWTHEPFFGHTFDKRNAENGHRKLVVFGEGPKAGRISIGQSKGDPPFSPIWVVLTADDVPSRSIRIKVDLFREKAWEWLSLEPLPAA